MSYDLYFTSPKISLDEFNVYFGENPRYDIDDGVALYSNEDTGVYFLFEHNSESADEVYPIDYSVCFNINYYRAHYFALEAEPELRKFIDHFGCSFIDEQMEGIESVGYSREGFLKGWNHGNELAYKTNLGRLDSPLKVAAKPTEELEAIWAWNSSIEKRNEAFPEGIVVPRIKFAIIDGALGSICVWLDGFTGIIPRVDFHFLRRHKPASKRLFKREAGKYCLVANEDFPEPFKKYLTDAFDLEAFKLPAPDMPQFVRDLEKGLDSFEGNADFVEYPGVLNLELVQKYQAEEFRFIAMEYYGGILNRVFMVFVSDDFLCGAKVGGFVSASLADDLSDNPLFYVKRDLLDKYRNVSSTSDEFLGLSSANYRIPKSSVKTIDYFPKKWGMGNVPHTGRLVLNMARGKKKEFVILGNQDPQEIKKRILQR